VEVTTEADPITEDSNIDFEKVEASAKSNSKEDQQLDCLYHMSSNKLI
jgi:hypothetical protein